MSKKVASKQANIKIIESNKKARRDYEIIDTLEAGIVLHGSEVKSIRRGGINISDSYVIFKKGECYLVGCHISPYKFTGENDAPDPMRERKLLLNRREIVKLSAEVQRGGLTIVPLKVYFNEKGRAKVEVALGRGKKLYDKRQDIKRREAEREIRGALKRGKIRK